MNNSSAKKNSIRTSVVVLLAVATALILLAVTARHQFTGFAATETAATTATGADDHATHITRLDDPIAAEINRQKTSRSGTSSHSGSRSATGARDTTATASNSDDDKTTDPAYFHEDYIRALFAQQEKDGKDNALLHYALAFELAPGNPTEEQQRLIKQVLEEGWDARADSLLPYIKAWEAAFREIEAGAALDYARGIGFEDWPRTQIPNYLKAQYAAKLLAVYSRYLAAQGQIAEAQKMLGLALTMGSDLKSPGNLVITHLIGNAIENVGLKQLAAMTDNHQLGGAERDIIKQLQTLDRAQESIVTILDGEIQCTMAVLQQLNEDMKNPPADQDEELASDDEETPISLEQKEELYRKAWATQSEYFSQPYWERKLSAFEKRMDDFESLGLVDFAELEARILSTTSRVRQQQIDLAARLYVADHSAPPSTISALVNGNYLPAEPIDPFTGQPFVYAPSGNSYTLYGSGPNIETPNNPAVNYAPVNGTFSQGVIRMR